MAARTLSLEELKAMKGQEIGVSDWHPVTQEEINKFADATHDHQWIHVDPERAKKESPFGGPIAHGYYTLSLAPHLMEQIVAVKGIRIKIKGSTLNLTTGPSNAQGMVKVRVQPKRAGIVTFVPVSTKGCTNPRIGVTGVFTPPVTG